MKKFVELIERVHKERFKVVANNLIDEKIPVAFLSVADTFENAVAEVNKNKEWFNITNLITATPPPSFSSEFQIDYAVTDLKDVSKIQPRPKYILTLNPISARVASKYLPDCKNLFLCGRTPAESIYEVFMNNLSELQKVYETFIDEESRRTFCGYWLGMITRYMAEFVYTGSAQYWTAGFIPKEGGIVIEGGTFDGRTAAFFSKMGYKVYGFEMNEKNFETAQKVAEENNFVVENMGLGSFKHEELYNSKGAASRFSADGEKKAKITTIDNYVIENSIPRVDFIKLDVEGSELEVLRGAKRTIARCKPILSISAYHKLDDFWTLMDFVKSIRTDYEWILRHYPYSSFEEELPRYTEEDFYSFGLEPEARTRAECCLLAR